MDLISNEQQKMYKTIFDLFDRDHDERLSHEDLKTGISALGIYLSDQEVMDMMCEVDRGDKNYIDFADMLQLILDAPRFDGDDDEDCKAAFDVFNKSGSGEITRDELFSAMNALGGKWYDQWNLIGCRGRDRRRD